MSSVQRRPARKPAAGPKDTVLVNRNFCSPRPQLVAGIRLFASPLPACIIFRTIQTEFVRLKLLGQIHSYTYLLFLSDGFLSHFCLVPLFRKSFCAADLQCECDLLGRDRTNYKQDKPNQNLGQGPWSAVVLPLSEDPTPRPAHHVFQRSRKQNNARSKVRS